MNLISQLLLSTFIFLNIACQTTSELYAFRQLAKDMDKGEVVEILGSPIRKERKFERDWWYYRFYEEGLLFERMVVFENGKLIYGGRVTTKKGMDNSESLDQLNERTNELATQEQLKASE